MSFEAAQLFPELPRSRHRATLQAVTEHSRVVEVPAGTPLVRHGAPQGSVFYLLEGACRVSVGRGDSSLDLGRLQAGDWIGKQCFFDKSSTGCATVVTDGAARLLEIRRQDFEALKRADVRAAAALVRTLVNSMAARIRATNALVESAAVAGDGGTEAATTAESTAARERLLTRAMASLRGPQGGAG